MSTVFISYRQTDDQERGRVRTFAERLRATGVDVVLDQFFLDANPGGPNDGWDKWSNDQAVFTERVLIVGTRDWFEGFEKKQPPGTALGAACEADAFRHRIYEAGGVNDGIRVMVFDDADAANVPATLKRYHRFHAERDFANIVRWLGGTVPRKVDATGPTSRTTIPHNLPSLQPFFGREEELKKIADALDPESRTYGALIDGPGGMGKTSLAVRAAYDAPPGAFKRIVFVSLKSRELDADGVRDLSGFLISGLAELFNEIARELGHAAITKSTDDERPRLLLNALRSTDALLVLDNLESLTKPERDTLFTFVKRLPQGCKAILTSRGRIGSGAEELILEKLGEEAALATLAKLAESNPALAKTNEAERLTLYRETGGKPLLLCWTAGQIGRGSCLTFTDAIFYLRSCPEGNDPLNFIFGDLVENFTEAETRLLCALTYFTLPVRVAEIAVLADCSEAHADSALRSLSNRSLVLPSEELTTFTLVPLVADFLRKKKPEVVEETGDRLDQRAFAIVLENGFEEYASFPVLAEKWPTVAAALPRFLIKKNARLQTMCGALAAFLRFKGRWDEQLALISEAEGRAVADRDYMSAGRRAYEIGVIHSWRGQATEVFACADRAEDHWHKTKAGTSERATVLGLRGIGHDLRGEYVAAIKALRESVALHRGQGEMRCVAVDLNDLALAKQRSGDLEGAESDFQDALRIARKLGYSEAVAVHTGNLAELALLRGDWPAAETLSRDAIHRSEKIGRVEVIAEGCQRLARALLRQGRKAEALPHARRAVDMYKGLGSPDDVKAVEALNECLAEG